MKKYNYISIIIMGMLIINSISLYSQTDENTYIINQYFQLNKENYGLTEKKVLSTNYHVPINVVSLDQIGSENQIDIKTSGNDSQGVKQIGNENYYQFINYYNSNSSNFNILQHGNGNSLQIYGENNLIHNLSIVQNTNFKTLIIKNY